VEINGSTIESQEDLNDRCAKATFINTLQASYTDFHYLRPIWKRNTEKDSLIGVGITGIGSNKLSELDLIEASNIVKAENARVAKMIGINPAARTTVIKPSGTTSCVLGTSSGIHAWHNDYYIRRCEFSGNNPIVDFFKEHYPQLIKPLKRLPGSYAIEIPCKAPEGGITRNQETAQSLLERVKYITTNWVKPGHKSGINSHNVSTTIYVRDDEWVSVGKWMWENRDNFNGMAVLPYDGGTYKEAPFEDITKEQYYEMMNHIPESIDWSKLIEEDDATQFTQEIACAGGIC